MATTKPRITITLSQRQHEVLRSISENSGQSMSTFVSEILELSLPTLERMAETFRKIKAAQDEQRKRIVVELEQAQSEVEPVLDHVMGQFDLFMSRIEEAAGVSGAPARSEARMDAPDAPAAAPAPVTNRGATGRKGKAGKAGQQGVSGDSKRRTSSKKGGMSAA